MYPGRMGAEAPDGIEDLIVTDRLDQRRAPPAPLQAEIAATHELARLMLEAPEQVLDRLVECATRLCGIETGGISLLSPEGDEGDGRHFQWHAVRGRFAPFRGQMLPHGASPCGIVVQRGAGVLFSHPERAYPDLAALGITVVEALLVPFMDAEGVACGTLWVCSHDQRRSFTRTDLETLTRLSAFASLAQATTGAMAAHSALAAHKERLLREMNHRIGNSLQLAGSVLRLQALRDGAPPIRRALEEAALRIGSIAHVHQRLYESSDLETVDLAAYLEDLFADILAPAGPAPEGRVGAGGGDAVSGGRGPTLKVDIRTSTRLAPEALTPLGLVVNELVTCAFRHGGRDLHCAVTVEAAPDGLSLTVTVEGPAQSPFAAERTGALGMALVEPLVAQLGGRIELRGIDAVHSIALTLPLPLPLPVAG